MLGKPRDAKDARKFFAVFADESIACTPAFVFSQESRKRVSRMYGGGVFPLDEIAESMIDRYVGSGAPMDKAGAYGIQDQAACW